MESKEQKARRLVFIPVDVLPFYEEKEVEFKWEGGFPTIEIVRKSSKNLTESAKQNLKLKEVFEVSRAGDEFFRNFSAFKLKIKVDIETKMYLEVVYQYSKVWRLESCNDLLQISSKMAKSREAKKTAKQKKQEKEVMERYCIKIGDLEREFPIEPKEAFYNWLYIFALMQNQNKKLREGLIRIVNDNPVGFTDIYYKNSKNRYNCQARAVAQFIGMYRSKGENFLLELFPEDSVKTLKGFLEGGGYELFKRYIDEVYRNVDDYVKNPTLFNLWE